MSVEGKWNVTMQTPLGTLRFSWDLANDGGAWRGRMLGQPPVGDSDLRSISVDGDALAFETTARSPMGPLELAFTGTVAADAITGVCKTAYGEFGFSAARG
jgi:hypothetical protein